MIQSLKLEEPATGYQPTALFVCANGDVWQQTSGEFEFAPPSRSAFVDIDDSGAQARARLDGFDYWVDVTLIDSILAPTRDHTLLRVLNLRP